MSESIELTLIVTVERHHDGSFAVELRRENRITLLGIYKTEYEAEAYAEFAERKLSSLIDAATDLLA